MIVCLRLGDWICNFQEVGVRLKEKTQGNSRGWGAGYHETSWNGKSCGVGVKLEASLCRDMDIFQNNTNYVNIQSCWLKSQYNIFQFATRKVLKWVFF